MAFRVPFQSFLIACHPKSQTKRSRASSARVKELLFKRAAMLSASGAAGLKEKTAGRAGGSAD